MKGLFERLLRAPARWRCWRRWQRRTAARVATQAQWPDLVRGGWTAPPGGERPAPPITDSGVVDAIRRAGGA